MPFWWRIRAASAVLAAVAIVHASFALYAWLWPLLSGEADTLSWRHAMKSIDFSRSQHFSAFRILVVAFILPLQSAFGFAFLPLTKMLCGYWFGWAGGLLVCAAFEAPALCLASKLSARWRASVAHSLLFVLAGSLLNRHLFVWPALLLTALFACAPSVLALYLATLGLALAEWLRRGMGGREGEEGVPLLQDPDGVASYMA